MITPFRDKIVEVLGQRLNYCWNSVNDTTKALIADELVKIITSDPPVIGSLPHIHKAGKDENIDTCGICGHDIRHEIHVRL